MFHVANVARRELERKVKEGFKKGYNSSGMCFGITYSVDSVALEDGVMDLHIGTIGINSSTLKVACSPPAIGASI
jgi:hypothetical protein